MRHDTLKTYLPAILIALIGFLIAFQFVDPAPPTTMTLSAGQAGGGYASYAEKFRSFLAQRGVTVTIQASAGSQENIQHLLNQQADIAFVQGGIPEAQHQKLLSLGSMYYEPLWVFSRQQLNIKRLSDLKGKRILIGKVGSGTRTLALQLLHANGIHAKNNVLMEADTKESVNLLLQGKADAAFFVASPQSHAVQQLLHSAAVKLMNFRRAKAYARTMHFLSAITLPEGAIDLKQNIPAQDTQLLATTATLMIHEDFHPALQDLMMQAASSIFGGAGLFEHAKAFPTADFSDVPLSSEARRYYVSGPPFLQRFLPFWAATMIDRLKVMLLPFLALLLPLFKVMPPLYRWRVRSRIYRWYKELGEIDRSLSEKPDIPLNAAAELNRIEAEIRKIQVPLSYADELYNLRLHLALIRDLVQQNDKAQQIQAKG